MLFLENEIKINHPHYASPLSTLKIPRNKLLLHNGEYCKGWGWLSCSLLQPKDEPISKQISIADDQAWCQKALEFCRILSTTLSAQAYTWTSFAISYFNSKSKIQVRLLGFSEDLGWPWKASNKCVDSSNEHAELALIKRFWDNSCDWV